MKKLNDTFPPAPVFLKGTICFNLFVKQVMIALFLCISVSLPAQTQDKKALQSKYEKLQDEIKDAEDLLKQTKTKKQNSLNEVKLIKRKIDVRQEMITTISQQRNAVNKEMSETQALISSMEAELNGLKDEYAKMIYYAYTTESDYEPLHFLFASESISDAIHEIQYIKEYTSYRKQQLRTIAETQSAMLEKINMLAGDKVEKENLLAKEQEQKNKLLEEKGEKDKTVKSFQGKEKEIAEQIKKKKKDATDLNKKIENIIAEEIRKEKEKAEAEAKKKKEAAAKAAAEKAAKEKAAKEKAAKEKTTTTTTPVAETKTTTATTAEKKTTAATTTKDNPNLTPEMNIVSKNFEGNKGKLPWPVERGSITERFGKHEHPVLNGVIIENNGVDISTSDGASVRCIFDGEVVNVIFNPSFQKGVIIKHGEYYTVYTNLETVSVTAGQKVTTKQKIGTAFTDVDEGKTEVHLEIWKGIVIMDPGLWISKL
ncbi:MAG: peptidoglycan DD-metalloendopeptidase family protein [Chitinophagales bacterium]|nr:peptidoglycan DD-metalloendopeptidase family protein [Chitinophagales bacterium]